MQNIGLVFMIMMSRLLGILKKCGNIVPLCVVTSICGRGGTKINVVTMW